LTAAIALVRAAGLGPEAEARAGAILPFTDTLTLPASQRGYIAVALSRDLLTASGLTFRPNSPLTRLELAHAMATIIRLAAQ
jgi:hypothetical protein